jgi:two-component system, chemotaxis family, sensor kinase Cph1
MVVCGQHALSHATGCLCRLARGTSDFDSPVRPVFSTDALSVDYPAGGEFADVASGVLAVPLSRHRRDLIVWFRPEKVQSVHWAGNPHQKPVAPNGQRPKPRRSFTPFVELVRQRSQAWLPVEIDSALHLRLLVMELVVSRTERLAELNADLTRSNDELDAFAYVASHDLKEPLRGIHKFAHQLLESAQIFDAESRRRVDSLMRLTVRMDSLLDSLLHFSRVGRTNLELEAVDLNQVVDEAVEMIGGRRADLFLDLIIPRSLPVWRSDRVRIREIFMNLLSNALKYARHESPRVEVGFIGAEEDTAPRFSSVAQGHTVFYVKDNGIGIDSRHFEQVFRLFKRLHGREEFGGGIGAGLTIVQKLVQRHGGQIWLESTVGVGSTFYFTLPCGEPVPP